MLLATSFVKDATSHNRHAVAYLCARELVTRLLNKICFGERAENYASDKRWIAGGKVMSLLIKV